jgi:hypothetical protein
MAGPRRHLPALALAAALAVVAVAVLLGSAASCSATADLHQGLTLLAPALALVAPLALGRYLGADRIARAAGRRARPRGRAAAAAPPAIRRPRAGLARGGALIAAALGRRGPPALRHA